MAIWKLADHRWRLTLSALLALACSSTPEPRSGDLVPLGAESVTSFDQGSIPESPAVAGRKMVRSGELIVSLNELEPASKEVERLVAEAGGYVEQSTANRDSGISLQCRIPAAQLDTTMDRIAALGDEKHRSLWAADVTDQYADLETRLRNNSALRDRLQALLKRATKVEDVLAIEKELNRIQSEVETMQGRLDRLKSQVELSALSVTLQRDVVLGPLGYVGYGFWWALSKLFVIRS
jgi:hypothetical protein